jgi:hypothetical protein
MNTNPLKAAEAARLKLREAGYAPIPVDGKIPLISSWQTLGNATAEDITSWTQKHPTHSNTGAITARMPTLDIDIKDPEAAEAVEQMVRDRFGDGGTLLFRYGNAPKRAIPFQTAKPFPKLQVFLIAPNGDTTQKLELLCSGQQVVVDGIHPDTHRPYEWRGGRLGEVKLVDLPHLNESEARTLVRDAAELLAAEHGYKIAPPRPKANGNAGDHHPEGAKDWSWLIDAIVEGGSLHDNTCALAAKVVAGGMRGGAAVNLIRAVMEQSRAPRDARFDDRLRDIPRLVSSAEEKLKNPSSQPSETEPIDVATIFAFVGDKPASPPKELIKGLVPAEGVAVTGGQSTAGKTFIQIYKSICLATTLPYFGHRIVERVGTAFVAAEGRGLIHNRFAAGLIKAEITQKLPITWLNQIPDFGSADGIRLFIRQLKELDRVFRGDFGVRLGFLPVDNVAACFAMKDEDDNAEATKVCNVLRSIGEETGVLAAPAHHYGKNPESGLRGASAWKASADIVEGVLADIDPLTGRTSNRELVCTKARDGEQGPVSPFELKFVKLGIDADGDDYGSCSVVPTAGKSRLDKKQTSAGKGERAILDAINEVMDGQSKFITPRAGMPLVRGVKVADLRPEFDRRYVVAETDPIKNDAAKRMAFGRALSKLPTTKFGAGSAEAADWIWLIAE